MLEVPKSIPMSLVAAMLLDRPLLRLAVREECDGCDFVAAEHFYSPLRAEILLFSLGAHRYLFWLVLIPYLSQFQPASWSCGSKGLAVAGVESLLKGITGKFAMTYVNKCARDDTRHIIQKAITGNTQGD